MIVLSAAATALLGVAPFDIRFSDSEKEIYTHPSIQLVQSSGSIDIDDVYITSSGDGYVVVNNTYSRRINCSIWYRYEGETYGSIKSGTFLDTNNYISGNSTREFRLIPDYMGNFNFSQIHSARLRNCDFYD